MTYIRFNQSGYGFGFKLHQVLKVTNVNSYGLNQWFLNFGGLWLLFSDSQTTVAPCLKHCPKSEVKTKKKGHYFETASDFFIFFPKIK